MCLYPKLIKNKKYLPNKRNGGNPPAAPDERVKLVPVGCGKCMECRKQKSRTWQVRLYEEIQQYRNGKFVTLTFTNESIKKLEKEVKAHWEKAMKKNKTLIPFLSGYDMDNYIATYAVRHFLERYRKKHKTSIRHWLITEIGHNGTENIHLHGIIWTDKTLAEIETYWQYGWIWKGKEHTHGITNYVNEQTINYITKYVTKQDEEHKEYIPKILCSKGIGANYMKKTNAKLNQYNDKNTNETYRTKTGHKISLPIYYRNKIYTEQEREQLWLQKLDKQIRWVNGEKIDISTSEDAYYNILKYHQEKNKRLGYGDDTINWERKIYEQERRNLKRKERIARIKTEE